MEWSEEEKEFLLEAKRQGRTMKNIAVAMRKKFGKHRKPTAISAYYQLIRPKKKSAKVGKTKYVSYSQELVDFVHTMYLNGYTKEQCIMGVKEQFNIVLSKRQFSYILYDKKPSHLNEVKEVVEPKEEKVWAKDTASRKQCFKIIDLGMPMLSLKEKNRMTNQMYNAKQFTKEEASLTIQGLLEETKTKKVMKTVPKSKPRKGMSVVKAGQKGGNAPKYSKEEEQQLLNCKDIYEAKALSESFGRTVGAISRKYYDLKNKRKAELEDRAINATFPPESLKDSMIVSALKNDNEFFDDSKLDEILYQPSKMVKHEENAWTPEAELDLLINFYELSIDEAKVRYGFSYEKIAGKLESLINSNNPDKIALVIEASKVVRRRKAAMIAELKNGFWKRRKAKKQAKREAKEKRKIQRLENKLKKMKGDE
jgi:hypothetical protein